MSDDRHPFDDETAPSLAHEPTGGAPTRHPAHHGAHHEAHHGARHSVRALERGILRDHATRDRIDRVWARLERELATEDEALSPPADVLGAAVSRPKWQQARAVLSVAAGFALGVGVAGWLWRGPSEQRPIVMQPSPVRAGAPTVLAAGTAPQTYALPGGGSITLQPGTIVDRLPVAPGPGDRSPPAGSFGAGSPPAGSFGAGSPPAGSFGDGSPPAGSAGEGRRGDASANAPDVPSRWRLVRGEATVEAPNASPLAVTMFVGQARVVSAGGHIRIRHDGDTAWLRVIDGSATVHTPHGERRSLRLGPSQEARVPVRVTTARRDPRHLPSTPILEPSLDGTDDATVSDDSVSGLDGPLTDGTTMDGEETAVADGNEADGPAPTVPSWVAACDEYDYEAAVTRFAEAGGDLASISDPKQLMCLGDGHLARRDGVRAAATYERILGGTGGDAQRALAAFQLVQIYQRLGDADKVAHYRELHRKLSKGRVFSAEALCQKIQSEAAAGHVTSVRRQSERYRSQFPNGACTKTIQKLLAELDAQARDDDGRADDEGNASDDADDDPYASTDAGDGGADGQTSAETERDDAAGAPAPPEADGGDDP
ncbi:MAG: hypothetical protein AAGN82_06300 [Myxococcota bacterium]